MALHLSSLSVHEPICRNFKFRYSRRDRHLFCEVFSAENLLLLLLLLPLML